MELPGPRVAPTPTMRSETSDQAPELDTLMMETMILSPEQETSAESHDELPGIVSIFLFI